MYKNKLINFSKWLIKPITSNPNLFLKIKDIYFTLNSEFLYRFIKYIKQNRIGVKDKIIVDVGSADGSVARFFSHHLNPKLIICFEPNQSFWDYYSNLTEKIQLIKKALTNSSGTAVLHITSNNLSSSLLEINENEIDMYHNAHRKRFKRIGSLEVKTSTLDDELYGFNEILVIKLDTQGTELNILKGGIEVLKRTKFIICEMQNHEIYNKSCKYYEIDSFLRGKGFKLIDLLVSYRSNNQVEEFDAIYENSSN